MKLKKVFIRKYNGLENVEINIVNDVQYLVSDNNVGKTRILKAINNFYNIKENAELEMTFIFNELDLAHISNNFDLSIQEETTFIQKEKKILVNDENVTSKIIDGKMLGQCFYIPTIIDITNEQDLSKAKNQLSTVLVELISNNQELKKMLDKFNTEYNDYVNIIKEKTKYLFENINNAILFDNTSVDLNGKEIEENQLIKNNLTLDFNNDNEIVKLEELGTGVQANIISSILTNFPKNQYTIILYDEPESFLNSTAQKKLITNIEKSKDNSLYLISTHSPFLIRKNRDTFKSIIRLSKNQRNVNVFQYNEAKYLNEIKKINAEFKKENLDDNYLLREDINKTILTWWETDRINALFEKKIFLVEGPTENVFFDMCLNEENYPAVCTIGKFKMPYFKVLFSDILGIDIICIYDKDKETEKYHKIYNDWLKKNIPLTIELNESFEEEMGYKINGDNEKRRKPEIFMEKLLNGELTEKIEKLKKRIVDIYNK